MTADIELNVKTEHFIKGDQEVENEKIGIEKRLEVS